MNICVEAEGEAKEVTFLCRDLYLVYIAALHVYDRGTL